ncbi:MAG TPA: carbamoyl-phosphate synthase domain-containing protein, partial [Plasticicumulans sp.]|nr:carbamoyl-phosphate synthase domain-containing protein [Plasticicumulans sp.]
MRKPALLALADGSLFRGESIGADGSTTGEVVFNTSITGYQEILTDPSYCRQIVTLTYPHIGNVGANPGDEEAAKIWSSGLVVRDCPPRPSSWRSRQSLDAYLSERGVVAIAGIDTRRLTRHLREQGAQNGCIVAGDRPDAEAAIAAARAAPKMVGLDLAQVVTTESRYEWTEGCWRLDGDDFPQQAEARFHVVAYDYGVKRNILRMLAARGCRVSVVPARTPAAEVLALR